MPLRAFVACNYKNAIDPKLLAAVVRNNFLDAGRRVPVMFMAAVQTANTPGAQPDPLPSGPSKESRVGRLLALVGKLIDYGRELAASLEHDPATRPRHFGIGDIALILARITRGLHRARALEERLVRNARRLDAPPKPRSAPSPHAPCRSRRPSPRRRPDDPRLADLPTPEQIAARVQRQPVGAVIADICRDLGVMPGELDRAFWEELRAAIIYYGGSLSCFLPKLIRQPFTSGASGQPDPAWPAAPPCATAAATGPP